MSKEKILSALNSGLDKIDKIQDQLDEKINILTAENAKAFSLLEVLDIPVLSKLNDFSLTGEIYDKLKNSNFGESLKNILSVFGNGFNLKKFLPLIIDKVIEKEQKINNARNFNNGFESNSFVSENEELIFSLTSDPNDLIFLSKIVLEDLVSEVFDRSIILSDISSSINSVKNDLDIIDHEYYENDVLGSFKNASELLLDSILELGEVDVSIQKFNEYDSNSFVSAQNKIDSAINEIKTTSFNDVSFSKSLNNIKANLERLKKIDSNINFRKENLSMFIENFEDEYVEQKVDKFRISEVISSIRDIKEKLDSFSNTGESLATSKKEELLVDLVSIKIILESKKQNILDSIKKVRELNLFDEGRENFEKYETMQFLLGMIVEEPLSDDVYNNMIEIFSKEEIRVKSVGKGAANILNQFDILESIIENHRFNESLYSSVKNSFTPRENPVLEDKFLDFYSNGFADIIDDIRKGDWKKVFGKYLNLKYGGENFDFFELQDLLSEGVNISNSAFSALKLLSNNMGSFKLSKFKILESRKKTIQRGVDDTKKDFERLDYMKEKIQTAIAYEKQRN